MTAKKCTKKFENIYLSYSVHILLFLLFSNMKPELSVKLSGEDGGKDRHFKVGSLPVYGDSIQKRTSSFTWKMVIKQVINC